ncbi:MAG TPA: carboxymuconolactone decarboxylase family protein [Cyclobacteriaceae bacterium]|nr:carboxymuconolactone decarboxylase family protein [Cyclobacteriaceae bacterium]HRF32799.1 carboxymuconolactone decarboxylase family protein [Cyclobacteriaceae bacterium]
MMKKNSYKIITLSLSIVLLSYVALAQSVTESKQVLSEKQKAIVLISTFTAKGDLAKLKQALNAGLDSKLTINESKEVLVHLYAYCGFPRSIQGLNTLITVLDERKAKGINDNPGREASPINDSNKYDAGWKNLAKLGGRPTDGPIEKPTSGYGAFSPEIDRFLKEHLFADLFSRDVLTFAERELTTISVLIALGKGVEPMLASHLALTMKQGITRDQIEEIFVLIEKSVSKSDADAARKVFSEMLSRN